MKTLCKVLLALLALFPVLALIWLALPQFSPAVALPRLLARLRPSRWR